MPTITVYQSDDQIAKETIEHEYYIVETSAGELNWFEEEPKQAVPGALRIWLQGRQEGFLLCHVFPEWQFIIDGVWMEKKFYEDIRDIEEKEVELRYKEYRFVFQF